MKQNHTIQVFSTYIDNDYGWYKVYFRQLNIDKIFMISNIETENEEAEEVGDERFIQENC